MFWILRVFADQTGFRNTMQSTEQICKNDYFHDQKWEKMIFKTWYVGWIYRMKIWIYRTIIWFYRTKIWIYRTKIWMYRKKIWFYRTKVTFIDENKVNEFCYQKPTISDPATSDLKTTYTFMHVFLIRNTFLRNSSLKIV